MSNIENPICQFENCNRVANYRKLKVGNCHLKNTEYEFCGYHRPINSISKNFPYRSIFDKINIELKYYNHQNDNIVHEYNDHIHKLLKNHKFNFPIKITAFSENLVYDTDYILPIDTDISNITNYKNYFDKDAVTLKDIFNVIRKFQKYYDDKKIEMLYIHLDKEHDTYDIIREFRNYYEEKIVYDIINDYSKNKKSLKLDNISNLLVDFNRYFNKQIVNKKIKSSNFKDYFNKRN